jgi:hypothetical protein
MRTRRTEDGAVKCALRHFRQELVTRGLRFMAAASLWGRSIRIGRRRSVGWPSPSSRWPTVPRAFACGAPTPAPPPSTPRTTSAWPQANQPAAPQPQIQTRSKQRGRQWRAARWLTLPGRAAYERDTRGKRRAEVDAGGAERGKWEERVM